MNQVHPYAPTGLEPPPKDWQYDVIHQMKKPLIFENREDPNDLRNFYNPNKYEHTLGEYLQISIQPDANHQVEVITTQPQPATPAQNKPAAAQTPAPPVPGQAQLDQAKNQPTAIPAPVATNTTAPAPSAQNATQPIPPLSEIASPEQQNGKTKITQAQTTEDPPAEGGEEGEGGDDEDDDDDDDGLCSTDDEECDEDDFDTDDDENDTSEPPIAGQEDVEDSEDDDDSEDSEDEDEGTEQDPVAGSLPPIADAQQNAQAQAPGSQPQQAQVQRKHHHHFKKQKKAKKAKRSKKSRHQKP